MPLPYGDIILACVSGDTANWGDEKLMGGGEGVLLMGDIPVKTFNTQ